MARSSFAGLVRQFRSIQRMSDEYSVGEQQRLLEQLSKMPCGDITSVVMYHEALLYSAAYPYSDTIHSLAESELRRVSLHVSRTKGAERKTYVNSGIAGAEVRLPLSLSMNRWLVNTYPSDTQLSADVVNESVLVQTLVQLFDPVEQEMLHAGKTAWKYWSEHMTGQGTDRHRMKKWIVEMAGRLPGSTSLKEFVFAQFDTTTVWSTNPSSYSLTSGRVDHVAPYIHEAGLDRSINLAELIARKPKRVALCPHQQVHLVDVAKGVLTTLQRETDPVTHANVSETEFYDMGRGLGIALYAMLPDMKMSVQSYIGFMVFKNHVPCAYGGGWVLNDECFFGVNVFPAFRGGESARIVGELLRVYKHAFHVKEFCVDPYQIGYGNPDGIKSRSFWFYYRLGFRPIEQDLSRLASTEFKRMNIDKKYVTSSAVLLKLAEATMRLNPKGVASGTPITADRLGDLVTQFVNAKYNGDRQLALQTALRRLNQRTAERHTSTHPIARLVVLLHASGYLDKAPLERLQSFVDDYRVKYINEYEYIRLAQKHRALFAALGRAERSM